MCLFVFLLKKCWRNIWDERDVMFEMNHNWDLHQVSERVTCETHSSLQQSIKADNFLMLWPEKNICTTESVSWSRMTDLFYPEDLRPAL